MSRTIRLLAIAALTISAFAVPMTVMNATSASANSNCHWFPGYFGAGLGARVSWTYVKQQANNAAARTSVELPSGQRCTENLSDQLLERLPHTS